MPDNFDEIETPSQRLLTVAPTHRRENVGPDLRGFTAFSSANAFAGLMNDPMPPALGASTRFVLRGAESCLIIGEPLTPVDASISAASEIVASAEVALRNIHSVMVATVARCTHGRALRLRYGAPIDFGESGVLPVIQWRSGFHVANEAAAAAEEELLRLWCTTTIGDVLARAETDAASGEAPNLFAAMQVAESLNREKLAAELDEDRQAWLYARDE